MNLTQISTASKRSLLTFAALALLTVPVPSAAQSLPGETEDPFHLIHRIDLEEGRVVGRSTSEIPREAFSTGRGEWKVPPPVREPRPIDKIHHELRAMDLGSPERHRLIVTFQDDLRVPRFPVLIPGEPDDAPANRAALARAQELIREIEERRADGYAGLARELEAFDATVVETFWLIKAMVVEMPLSNVEALADRADVQAVEPEQTRDLPPQNASSLDDVQDGRAHILSDPYFNLTSGNIALLDTGVRSTHTLFQNPARLRNLRDCVNGGSTCNIANAGFTTADVCNHGTSSAGIVSGNANFGDAFRGVTAIKVDSFRVYAAGTCFLNQTAATRGFQNAMALLNTVILAEIQATGANGGAVETAADAAFDAGFMVIAPNGNQGEGGTVAGSVTSPARAQKTIGIGALAVQGLVQYSDQSLGPASDDRIKPDIQAPTNTETASNVSNSAFRIHTGTSGAAPYAAGAAALMRNWAWQNIFSVDPGQIYSALIVSGQRTGAQINNMAGTGLIKLPNGGTLWLGKVSIVDGQMIDIPLTIPGATTWTLFDGALWWPEPLGQEDHNDIDLYLVDPFPTELANSVLVESVFERARVSSFFLFPGTTWTLRIRGYDVPEGPQTVYWAAYIH